MKNRHTNRAFSLIELVIVIIILGVISAIAIPRMMKGADGADVTALQADLSVLRSAMEMYRYEHGGFPAVAGIGDALTKRTDKDGTVNAAAGEFGPYIVKVPPLKTGAQKGETGFSATAGNPAVAGDVSAGSGWLYDESSGGIWANDADHLDK